MSRIMSGPAAVMGGAKVRSAAPAVTAASTAETVAAASSATATALASRERQICRANRNPERADTRGKSQDNKPPDKFFADPAHDVFLPQKGISFGAPPTPL
jgi:hypothetical protein